MTYGGGPPVVEAQEASERRVAYPCTMRSTPPRIAQSSRTRVLRPTCRSSETGSPTAKRGSSNSSLSPWLCLRNAGLQTANRLASATLDQLALPARGELSAELALAPAADHQTGLEVSAERGIIIGQEAIIVAVVGQTRLRSYGASDGDDRVRIVIAQDILERL